MIVKFVYKGSCSLLEDLGKLFENNKHFSLESFDEEHHKERKKALQIKASCGARLSPFVAIYNENKELVHAFYSEVGKCTYNEILKYVKEWERLNTLD